MGIQFESNPWTRQNLGLVTRPKFTKMNPLFALKLSLALLTCQDINCLNSRPCMRIGYEAPREICLCGPNFYGPRCEFSVETLKDSLFPRHWTAEQVGFDGTVEPAKMKKRSTRKKSRRSRRARVMSK